MVTGMKLSEIVSISSAAKQYAVSKGVEDIKAADHTIKRLDKANQKDAERHVKSINSESATDAGGIFDFDLM